MVDYAEHAIGSGADATAVAYVETVDGDGTPRWGVGVHPNIITASLQAVAERRRAHPPAGLTARRRPDGSRSTLGDPRPVPLLSERAHDRSLRQDFHWPRAGRRWSRAARAKQPVMRVVVDFDVCASTGSCMQVCPEVFEVRSDGYLYILQEEPRRGAARQGDARPPTSARPGAITIEE